MTEKHIKKGLSTIHHWEMLGKPTPKVLAHPHQDSQSVRVDNTCWRNQASALLMGACRSLATLKRAWMCPQTFLMEWPHSPTIPLLGVPGEVNTEAYTWMFRVE